MAGSREIQGRRIKEKCSNSQREVSPLGSQHLRAGTLLGPGPTEGEAHLGTAVCQPLSVPRSHTPRCLESLQPWKTGSSLCASFTEEETELFLPKDAELLGAGSGVKYKVAPGKLLHALPGLTLDSVLLLSFLGRWMLIAGKGLGSAGPQTRGGLMSLISRVCAESFLPRKAEEKYTELSSEENLHTVREDME